MADHPLPSPVSPRRHDLPGGHGLSEAQEAELGKRALLDVSARTIRGVFAYALGWLLVCQGGDFFQEHRAFVLWNLAGLSLIGVFRFTLHRRFRHYLDHNFSVSVAVFRFLVMCNGLHWGILLAIGMTWREAEDIRPFITPVSIALMMAGTIVMAIERVVALAFPVAVMVPAMVAMMFDINSTNAVFVAAAAGFLAYAWAISRVLSADYWDAQRARFLLEDRARELEQVSLTDALTRIPNRLFLDRRLPVAWLEARRQQYPLALALIDLDHFKRINDTHGHPVGDRCLQEVATALRDELLRPSDMVARYGGEEFIVVMPDTDEAGAMAVAQRMRERVKATIVHHQGLSIRLSCSVGLCVTVPRSADGAEQLVQHADEALYRSKSMGRDRVTMQAYDAASGTAGDSAI